MNYRKLGKTNFNVSEIALGTWQVGGGWGQTFDHQTASRIIHTALDAGVNFIDTADVYDAGLSEAAVGKAIRERSERIYVATKCGRQIQPHVHEGYTPEILRKFVEASLKNMALDTIDLIQLHCPPTPVYKRAEIFGLFDRLKEEGKIQHLGVSVETVEEAEMALEFPNVSTVQIIFNMFRLKPSEKFFAKAQNSNCGIIVRVPLASGLLTGKLHPSSSFPENDHRTFNRQGEAFDKGETFSGVPFDLGLEAAEELKLVVGNQASLAAFALRWVLMFPEVSTVIPGASKPAQVQENIAAAELPALKPHQMDAVKAIYEKYIKKEIHHLW